MNGLFEKGKWIENKECPLYVSPVFSTEFEFCEDKKAQTNIYISGLGFYTLTVNGERIKAAPLSPAFSAYDKTVYYNCIDISEYVFKGENEIRIFLGNGWFNEPCDDSFDFEHAAWKHRPILICEIYTDGKLVCHSGSHWKCGTGKTGFNSLRAGEDCDFTKSISFNGFASVSKGPGGILKKQISPDIFISRNLIGKKLSEALYDFGENIQGDVCMKVKGNVNEKIYVIYGERLGCDGHIDQTMIKRRPSIQRTQTDILTLNGHINEFTSSFSYKGFRYVEIIGKCSVIDIYARVFKTDFDTVGGFDCSNSDINKLISAVNNSTMSNFICGIPTDCPHREKNGWTGDAHVSCEQALFTYGMYDGYISYLDALCDCQRADGELPCIAPTSVYGFNFQSGPTWDAAIIMIPWQLYMYSGDKSYLERYFKNMKRYAGYIDMISEDGICKSGLGDFLPQGGVPVCPDGMVLSLFSAKLFLTLSYIASALGYSALYTEYKKRSDYIFNAVKREYAGKCERTQSYLTMLLYFGISPCPEKDAAELNRIITENGFLSGGGLFSSVYVLDVLTEYGYFDSALNIVLNKKMPGWLNMLKNGSGTLWEHWDGEHGSLNHHMRSPVAAWIYRTLAGINISAPGFSRVTISPHITEKISGLNAYHVTPYGKLRVKYDREKIDITVPEGIEAVIDTGKQKFRTTKSISLERFLFE